MRLPFSEQEFLLVFAAYNQLFWPVIAIFWILTMVGVVSVLQRVPYSSRVMALLLAVHWAWSGVVYHLLYFESINPAAVLFGLLFLVEAALLAWRGARVPHLTFAYTGSTWGKLGLALVVYALAYPAISALTGLRYPALPLFAVPCPTAILTAGLLLLAPRHEVRLLGWIPVLWSLIGGSAAFTLGIVPDLALPLSGVLLLGYMWLPVTRERAAVTTVAGENLL